MAIKKKTTEKTPISKDTSQKNKERLDKIEGQLTKGMKEAKKVGDEVVKKLNEVKTKFDKMDDATKKKVVAGITGAFALVAGLGIAKHTIKKHKKTKK